jgi:DNA-binding NtrC family response regulator
MSLLNLTPVLVADDQLFIALDLAMAVEDAGGIVVGPAASVTEALALVEAGPVAAAILDVNLSDRDISPVVEILARSGVPVILQTAVEAPLVLSDRFPNLVVRIKPCVSGQLVKQLAGMIADCQQFEVRSLDWVGPTR